MGEIAEQMLNGDMCEGCGEYFDDILEGEDGPGYPRRCPSCQAAYDRANRADKPKRKGRR